MPGWHKDYFALIHTEQFRSMISQVKSMAFSSELTKKKPNNRHDDNEMHHKESWEDLLVS